MLEGAVRCSPNFINRFEESRKEDPMDPRKVRKFRHKDLAAESRL